MIICYGKYRACMSLIYRPNMVTVIIPQGYTTVNSVSKIPRGVDCYTITPCKCNNIPQLHLQS